MTYLRSWTFLLAALSLSVTSWANTLVITEFMARNDDVLADQDGDFSDWIEIFNAGDMAVLLEAWSLTDDTSALDKWKFPAVIIQPNTFLLVFASGKDLTDPASELHTSFKLSSGGEYLALVDPTGLIVSEFQPEFEPQVPYASYGINMGSEVAMLVEAGAIAQYHVPTDDTLGLTWVERDFDAGAWASGPTGIGFDDNRTPKLDGLIQTDILEEMRRVNSSVYIRIPFTVDDPANLSALLLYASYEDGMVVWVNGKEVARKNLRRDELVWNARAARSRLAPDALAAEQINLSSSLDVLVAGANVLAIQGLNSSSSNSDLLVLPVLEGVIAGEVKPDVREYFPSPSPGWPNSGGVPGIAEEPQFSRQGGAFIEPFNLELMSAAAQIRFTLDVNEQVTEASTPYAGPILIDGTVVVRARAYEDGLLPSPTVETSFVEFDAAMADVSSNLPIVVINTFGKRISGQCDRNHSPAHIMVIERGDDGRAHILGEPQYAGNIGVRARGASTCNRQKISMNIEFRDENEDDLPVEVLGFPKDSDFILYGAYNFDQALIRNAFIYEISNQVERWAPRSRPVEVYLNEGRGAVRPQSYWGVYSFMEKIKRSKDRVDIASMSPPDSEEPEVSGGYIFKIDRNQEGEPTVPAAGIGSVVIEYPKDITPVQSSWLRVYLTQMNAALSRPDPLELGSDFIDVDSWIDHHILMMFPKNVDAFRLSGYFYKDREGKLGRGPIWDYDRSMESTDGRDDFPDRWENNGGDGGTRYFTNDWWRLLFKGRAVDQAGPPPLGDDEWAVRYRARWRELRAGPLSTENLLGVIQGMADEIGESAERNWTRWGQGSRDYSVPINHLKNWIAARVDWIDSQFIDTPVFSQEGGLKTEPLELEITVSDGDIFYTLNGPDPRLANGNLDPAAIEYAGPITIDTNTRVWARARVGGAWSESVIEGFYFELAPFVVTEINYNPAGGSDHEFVEFQNVGSEPLDLTGFRLVDSRVNRVLFDFTGSDITTLGPGEYAVAVRDALEFSALYGEGIPVAGELARSLSNTRMSLDLLGSVDEPLLVFGYDDDWEPTTDGDGYTMVIRDPYGPREAWADAPGWRASLEVGGSPGRIDGDQPAGLQLPGDLTQDGKFNLTDAIGILRHFFQGGAVLPCASAAGNDKLLDVNGDAAVNLTDAVYTLAHLFQAGPPPALGVECVPIEGCPAACQ